MVAAAVIGSAVVGGVMSSNAQKSAASTAASAQQASSELSVAEQRRQFDAMKELLAPYVQAGEPALQKMAAYAEVGPQALEQQTALAGLQGPEAQQAAITAIEQSPLFQAQVRQGEEAILQQASATGGLRGGNVQGALAQYRPQMLQQELANRYNMLGGLTTFGAGMTQNLSSIGQASAAGQAQAGLNTASNIGAALQNAGQAQAQAALASGQSTANMWGNIAGSVGTAAGLGLLKF